MELIPKTKRLLDLRKTGALVIDWGDALLDKIDSMLPHDPSNSHSHCEKLQQKPTTHTVPERMTASNVVELRGRK